MQIGGHVEQGGVQRRVHMAQGHGADLFRVLAGGAPILFPEFPRLIDEPLYLYSCLENLMAEHDVGVEEFLTAHAKIAQREKVNIRVRSEMEGIHSILNP